MRALALALVITAGFVGQAAAQNFGPISGGGIGGRGQAVTGSTAGTGGSGPAVSIPTVTNVAPGTGTTAGGNTVIVVGTQFIGLSGAAAVTFGGVNALSYSVSNQFALTAQPPPHAAGTVEVRVTNPIGQSALNPPNDNYTYAASCSQSADFSQACNSQYIAAFF